MHAPTDVADDRSFGSLVLEPSRPALVLFTAEGCLPCAFLARRLPELASGLDGVVGIVRCPLESSPRAFRRYAVSVTPTLVLFKAGSPIASQVGPAPIPAIRHWVAEALARRSEAGAPAGNPITDTVPFSSSRLLLRRLVSRPVMVGVTLVVGLIPLFWDIGIIRSESTDGYTAVLGIGLVLLVACLMASSARGLSAAGRAVPAPRPRP